MEDLDDPELTPVVEPSDRRVGLGGATAALLFGGSLGAQGVHEEDASAGPEGGPYEVPEGKEASVRHVREPETEKDHVVCVIRAPVEQVGQDVADRNLWAGLPEPGAVDLKHLG